MTNETISKIQDDLKRLREAMPEVFGASSHQFKLHAPLTEKEVQGFETKNGIRLPDEYRLFLTRLGNGGAGPYYGVFKLGEMDDSFEMARWKASDGFVGDPSQSFPHSKPWNELPEEPDESLTGEELDAAYEDFDRIYWDSRQVNGAIPICHHGCALRDWLVVTGAEAGNVWHDARVDRAGLRPVSQGKHERLTFLRWYMAWLEESLASLP